LGASPEPKSPNVWLARGFAALAAATFVLIVFGAVVRAQGAGLACPDWPLCFGELVPRFDVRVALEWGHRLLAGSISLAFAGLTWAVVRRRELRGEMAGKLTLAWALLTIQVVLGGLTVLQGLAPWTVTGHLLVGNTFCALLLWTSRDLSEPRTASSGTEEPPAPVAVSVLILTVAVLVAVQVALGGLVSSYYAGLACPYFPTCDGSSIAPTLRSLIGLHVVHRLAAFGLTLAVLILALVSRSVPRVAPLVRSALRLVILQLAVGAANVLFRLPVEVTALHSATAAGLVLVTALLVREQTRLRVLVPVEGDHQLGEVAHTG
jgi:cytochrome c oxidase assembly protein subunit 15